MGQRVSWRVTLDHKIQPGLGTVKNVDLDLPKVTFTLYYYTTSKQKCAWSLVVSAVLAERRP